MQKINFILIIIILCAGCSVIKKGGTGNAGFSNGIMGQNLLESIKKQNITRNGFLFKKLRLRFPEKMKQEDYWEP